MTLPPNKPKVTLTAYSFAEGLGGIPRVARLMQRALEGLEPDVRVRSLELVRGTQASKSKWQRLKLLVRHRLAALRSTHMVYDSCQMAQLHNLFPRLRLPSLVFIHGIEVWNQTRPDWLRACQTATCLVSNSAFTPKRAHELHGHFSRTQPCWLATVSDEPPPPVPKSSVPTVLIVSRIDKQEGYKGHIELIQCWPQVLQIVSDARLRVVGRGSGLEDLKVTVEKLGLTEHVQFDGFVAEADLERIYGQSHVFAMPSRGEGFGLVYIEAMRCALPVITSTEDAGQEVNVDGITGYTVDLNEPSQLADRIIRLLKDPQHASQMGSAGQLRWQQNFTPSKFIHRFQVISRPFLDLPINE